MARKTLLEASVGVKRTTRNARNFHPAGMLGRIADWAMNSDELLPEEQSKLDSLLSSGKDRIAILKAVMSFEAGRNLARLLGMIEKAEMTLSSKDLEALAPKDLIRLLSVLYGSLGNLKNLMDDKEPDVQVNILNQQQNHLNLPPVSREKIRRLIEQNLQGEPG